jgi:hypothetical protein
VEFNDISTALASAVVLALLIPERNYILHINTSDGEIDGVQAQ